MIKGSKLSDHKFKKGKFITPFNDKLGDKLQENPWFQNRLPEYLWLGLILNHYGRDEGLKKCSQIFKQLYNKSDLIKLPKLSMILNLSDEIQDDLYNHIKSIIDIQVLSPLTIVLTFSEYPVFSSQFCSSLSIEDRLKAIDNVMSKTHSHQSELSTDIRFLVVAYLFNTDRLHLTRETAELIVQYQNRSHEDEIMRMIRPTIRACEVGIPDNINSHYLNSQYNFSTDYCLPQAS